MTVVVLDIGGTSIKSGKFTGGHLTMQKEYASDAKKGGDCLMKQAISIIEGYKEFDAIGISTAGQVDSERGCITYANSNIPGYTGMQIREILMKEFHVPVAVENDVNAAALGEAKFGAGREYKDFLCLTYGTGVGGAVILDGKLYKGCGSAGEFGAMVVHPEARNPQQDSYSGCYEKYASTTALVEKARQLDVSLDSGRKIFERIEEAFVRKIVDNWIDEIVYGLITLINVFHPAAILLGGGVMKQDYVIDKVREKLYEQLMPSFQSVKILQAALYNEAGLYGAASLLDCVGDCHGQKMEKFKNLF